MNRRDFLQGVTLSSIVALNYGCSIKPLVKDKNKKLAIVYATKYGATKDTSLWIAKGLQREVDFFDIEQDSFENIVNEYDYFIIGSGVWIDGVHKDLIAFLKENKEELENKIIASFIVCGTSKKDKAGEERISQYFSRFHSEMIKKPLVSDFFGGRIIIEQLSKKDRTILENFYKKVLKREFKSWDKTQPYKAESFGKTFSQVLKTS